MNLNRIQVSIFKKLSQEQNLDADAYIEKYSMEFLGIQRESLESLSEEEGDCWIDRSYLISLEGDGFKG